MNDRDSGTAKVLIRVLLCMFITSVVCLLLSIFTPDPWWITAGVAGIGFVALVVMLIPSKKAEATDATAADAATPATAAAATAASQGRLSVWPLAFVVLLIGIAVIMLWKGGDIWGYFFGDGKPAMASVKKETQLKIDAPTYKYRFYGEIKPGEIKLIEPQGPINLVFDEFTAPISFKWRQHNGSGSWKTLMPSQAGKTYHYALIYGSNRRHPKGLPLMIKVKSRTHVTVRPY